MSKKPKQSEPLTRDQQIQKALSNTSMLPDSMPKKAEHYKLSIGDVVEFGNL